MNAHGVVTMEVAKEALAPVRGLTEKEVIAPRRQGELFLELPVRSETERAKTAFIGGAAEQEFIDLVAVLNAVRVALPFGALRDF